MCIRDSYIGSHRYIILIAAHGNGCNIRFLGIKHCRIIKQDHHVKILALDHFHKLFVTAYAACKKFMHMQVCLSLIHI